MQSAIEQWNLPIPASLQNAWDKLGPDDAVGVWKLSPGRIEPASLEAGGPVNLFVIGDDEMGDLLCLQPHKFKDDAPAAVVMWDPATRQITRLGDTFDAFLEQESLRRLDFLLERGPALDEATVACVRKGEAVDWESFPKETRIISELIGDVCRVADRLGLPESIADRASGKAGSPEFLREVDGRDEPGIEQAIGELRKSAESGDAAAAFEVLGFLQIRQKTEELAQWAFTAAKCSLYSWPNVAPGLVNKVAEILKANAAGVKAVDRLDPLFSFITTQPPAKIDARLNLAKQYFRKKDYPAAAREAENTLCLAGFSNDAAAQRAAYDLLVEVFKAAGRSRELAYAELMRSKLAG